MMMMMTAEAVGSVNATLHPPPAFSEYLEVRVMQGEHLVERIELSILRRTTRNASQGNQTGSTLSYGSAN